MLLRIFNAAKTRSNIVVSGNGLINSDYKPTFRDKE